MVAKLHAILRPFLLRRMKTDVEQMLPRKKEIILYASMTEHQKHLQEHLINKTLENYLLEKGDRGMTSVCISENCDLHCSKIYKVLIFSAFGFPGTMGSLL